MLSIYTTLREPDEKFARTAGSIRYPEDFEWVVTAVRDPQKASAIIERAQIRNYRVIHTPEANIAEGLNACVQHCRGEYLWVLNSGDEEIDIRPIVELLAEHREDDFAVGGYECRGRLYTPRAYRGRKVGLILHGMGFNHGAAVVRRRFHDRYGLYPTQYKACMDAALFIKAIWQEAPYRVLNQAVSRIEPGGISSRTVLRTDEMADIISAYLPFPVPLLLKLKWRINSILAEWLRR